LMAMQTNMRSRGWPLTGFAASAPQQRAMAAPKISTLSRLL
jgi:hypothetical protein